jgi:predicted Holliday junction resolvase-like endonuclease
MPETPFQNVEAAHEYVRLLAEAVRQARAEVVQDLEEAKAVREARREEALRLVAWKLERLEAHLESSRHLLNDLRRMRRLLLGEDVRPPSPRGDPDDHDEPWGT